jgi:hypothetical protein
MTTVSVSKRSVGYAKSPAYVLPRAEFLMTNFSLYTSWKSVHKVAE